MLMCLNDCFNYQNDLSRIFQALFDYVPINEQSQFRENPSEMDMGLFNNYGGQMKE